MAIAVERMGTDTARKRRALVPQLHPQTGNRAWYADAQYRNGQDFAIARDTTTGLVVGYVAWNTYRTRGFQPSVTVYGLYGTPAAGIRGVGRALMSEVARVAQEQGAELSVSGMVANARSFYEAIGADTVPHSSIGSWSDAARDRLAASGRNAAAPALAGTGNS